MVWWETVWCVVWLCSVVYVCYIYIHFVNCIFVCPNSNKSCIYFYPFWCCIVGKGYATITERLQGVAYMRWKSLGIPAIKQITWQHTLYSSHYLLACHSSSAPRFNRQKIKEFFVMIWYEWLHSSVVCLKNLNHLKKKLIMQFQPYKVIFFTAYRQYIHQGCQLNTTLHDNLPDISLTHWINSMIK